VHYPEPRPLAFDHPDQHRKFAVSLQELSRAVERVHEEDARAVGEAEVALGSRFL
jgi:hypothetical protein